MWPMALFGRETEREQTRAVSYAAWFARQHPLALASLLLSAFSLTHFGTLWVDTIVGIAFGVVALVQIRRAKQSASADDPPPRTEGQWLAWGGIVVGLVSLTLAFVIYFVLPGRAR
jgi:uncharacterized membrane protein YfcA